MYGEEVFNQDYPGIVGTDASRVVGCVDGQVVGDFQFIEAHGHAFHHCMWYHLPTKTVFSGDAMGFGFKEINMCPLLCTSPTQYDSKSWRQTIKKIEQLNPDFI